MHYDERPWLKSYDKVINADIEIPTGTFVDLLDDCLQEFPTGAAYHFLGVTHTFADFDRYTAQFAQFLQKVGCQPGDVVGVNLPNIPQYLIAHVGALRAGCVVTGLSPLLTAKEMEHQLQDSGAKVLVTLDAIFEHRFKNVSCNLPKLGHVVATGILDYLPAYKRVLGKLLKKVPTGRIDPITDKGVYNWCETLPKQPFAFEKPSLSPEDLCLIQYTGGTTGLPKGAELTHRNMVANLTQASDWLQFERGSEVFCFAFPFFHLAGLALGMACCITGSTQILIPNPRDTKAICRQLARYDVTGIGNVPSLYQMLLDTPAFKKLDFSRVRICGSGAAPFAVESIRELEAVVGEGKVVEVYGMTETSPFLTINPVQGKKKVGTVGLPIQNVNLRIVDIDTGTQCVPLGEEGQIIARGPNIMRGYHNKPEETSIALRELDGHTWLYTGDIARMDEDGFISIVDRAKDMLIVGGYKVFSREVEEKLYEHPAIELCAIVGEPNPRRPGSELVTLFVQLRKAFRDEKSERVIENITQFCRENMAPYKVPKKITLLDSIPLTTVGKVDKKALR